MRNPALRLADVFLTMGVLLQAFCCAGAIVSTATNAAPMQSSLTNAPAAGPAPLIRFGVVADVQYADKPAEGRRHYREALARLDACLGVLNRSPLDFVMNLGDLIDGNGAASVDEFKRALGHFDRVQAPVHHVLGNHCLAVDRATALRLLRIEPGYYAFQTNGWRFIVLDGMDVSAKSPTNSPGWIEARKFLAVDPPPPDWNGALGARQMQWLKDTLADVSKSGQKAVVFCHHPVISPVTNLKLVLWNADDVLKVLESSGCVAAYVCGHDHKGAYAERNGIHHVTFPGIVEAGDGDNRCAVIEVYQDHLRILGSGTVPGRDLQIRSSLF